MHQNDDDPRHCLFHEFPSEMLILLGLLNEIGAILQHEKGFGASYQQVSADELPIEEHFAAIVLWICTYCAPESTHTFVEIYYKFAK
jgi:hypothetical protein